MSKLLLVGGTIFLVIFLTGCGNKAYSNPSNYKCPVKEHIDCMPIVSKENQPFCEPNFRQWIEKNCTNIYFTD